MGDNDLTKPKPKPSVKYLYNQDDTEDGDGDPAINIIKVTASRDENGNLIFIDEDGDWIDDCYRDDLHDTPEEAAQDAAEDVLDELDSIQREITEKREEILELEVFLHKLQALVKKYKLER